MANEPFRIKLPPGLFDSHSVVPPLDAAALAQSHEVVTLKATERLILPSKREIRGVSIKKDAAGNFYLELEE